MASSFNSISLYETRDLVEFITKERDSLKVYSRHPKYQNTICNSIEEIWGRIFSFLSIDSKKNVVLVCKNFYVFIKKAEERRIQAMCQFITDNYLIFDTNTDSEVPLEKK